MSARRQLEQGDSLSHRTFRWRQVTQLRCLGAALTAEGAPGDVVTVACFSVSEFGAAAPVAVDIAGGFSSQSGPALTVIHRAEAERWCEIRLCAARVV